MIEEGTFTFTDYEVSVQEIIKSNSAGLVTSGTFTTTRSGGSVKLNGHVVHAIDRREEPLKIGSQYIFFLRLIPDTGAYRPAGNSLNEDTFELSDGKVIQLSEKSLPFKRPGKSANAGSFISDLRAVLNHPCNK